MEGEKHIVHAGLEWLPFEALPQRVEDERIGIVMIMMSDMDVLKSAKAVPEVAVGSADHLASILGDADVAIDAKVVLAVVSLTALDLKYSVHLD